MLLGKREKDKFEVYNDYNHNLTNLFRVMIFRPNAFKIELGFCHLNSRDFFEEWKRRINTEDFKNPYFEEELKLTQDSRECQTLQILMCRSCDEPKRM